ncbi:multiple epidermal growth factor-like domains 10 [Elysia marginata]|uniref:Multiple epidermal growth factor-like domains 10 n=1 Tax=Elysia marginata TaxID=1093978 RepID=A0AAV4EE71_9GAST|nr:multiple epidermal growth factor-like domains 10 [Elysia marginata]
MLSPEKNMHMADPVVHQLQRNSPETPATKPVHAEVKLIFLVNLVINHLTVITTECALGTYGNNCTKNCSSHCDGHHNKCHHETGDCSSGCAAGYKGSKCDSECNFNTYGTNCSQRCSSHCGEPYKACHHVTGKCFSGCVVGYEGERCHLPCHFDTYGMNCSEMCSLYCRGKDVGISCNPKTGECRAGCDGGFIGPKCESGIPIDAPNTDEYSFYWFLVGFFASCITMTIFIIVFCKKTQDTEETGERRRKGTKVIISMRRLLKREHGKTQADDTMTYPVSTIDEDRESVSVLDDPESHSSSAKEMGAYQYSHTSLASIDLGYPSNKLKSPSMSPESVTSV